MKIIYAKLDLPIEINGKSYDYTVVENMKIQDFRKLFKEKTFSILEAKIKG